MRTLLDEIVNKLLEAYSLACRYADTAIAGGRFSICALSPADSSHAEQMV